MIIDGHARVVRHGTQVAELGPGGFFGDLALLDRAPRNASVIAETDMDLVKLGQRAFDELLNTAPGFAKKLLAGLARRLRVEDAKNLEHLARRLHDASLAARRDTRLAALAPGELAPLAACV